MGRYFVPTYFCIDLLFYVFLPTKVVGIETCRVRAQEWGVPEISAEELP
jgi:hypothetical protein